VHADHRRHCFPPAPLHPPPPHPTPPTRTPPLQTIEGGVIGYVIAADLRVAVDIMTTSQEEYEELSRTSADQQLLPSATQQLSHQPTAGDAGGCAPASPLSPQRSTAEELPLAWPSAALNAPSLGGGGGGGGMPGGNWSKLRAGNSEKQLTALSMGYKGGGLGRVSRGASLARPSLSGSLHGSGESPRVALRSPRQTGGSSGGGAPGSSGWQWLPGSGGNSQHDGQQLQSAASTAVGSPGPAGRHLQPAASAPALSAGPAGQAVAMSVAGSASLDAASSVGQPDEQGASQHDGQQQLPPSRLTAEAVIGGRRASWSNAMASMASQHLIKPPISAASHAAESVSGLTSSIAGAAGVALHVSGGGGWGAQARGAGHARRARSGGRGTRQWGMCMLPAMTHVAGSM